MVYDFVKDYTNSNILKYPLVGIFDNTISEKSGLIYFITFYSNMLTNQNNTFTNSKSISTHNEIKLLIKFDTFN